MRRSASGSRGRRLAAIWIVLMPPFAMALCCDQSAKLNREMLSAVEFGLVMRKDSLTAALMSVAKMVAVYVAVNRPSCRAVLSTSCRSRWHRNSCWSR